MKMYILGRWVDRDRKVEVFNPFDGSVLDAVPDGTAADATAAVDGAVQGAAEMRNKTAYERSEFLQRAARLLEERSDDFARTISSEEGKTLKESRGEVSRAVQTLQLSAEEAKRITGEVLPLDAAPHGAGKFGFTLRIPCGVVVAITPFNFPLNLVCHKVGPALAAGNAVVIKPASDTPLSALKLVELLLEAGVPALAIACVTGGGGEIGGTLAKDGRVRKISFTGSRDVGEKICQTAGLKRVTMELGSNSPLIVMPDADLSKVAAATIATGYSNAGQTCISAQRVIVVGDSYQPLIEALTPLVAALRTGNPLDDASEMGPLVREKDAERVQSWIEEAVAQGAKLITGNERQGAMLQPALVADVGPQMRISRDELFGPAVGIAHADSIEEAITLANDSNYGLSAALFTENLSWAMQFAQRVDAGNLHINYGPGWRADLMPYGGLKDSGFGKEGPKYAIEAMTELKTVVIHGV